ncbi:hypothetical protein [Sorangium sp. So ce1078]|uniref:hypothetical protein n=1 Tax=Sorangium sp. So ce1078 TaxID=3133329 RepID=UPI003F5DFBA9
MSNRRTIHTGLGIALFAALVGEMGSACVGAPDPSAEEEATGEVEQADVVLFPPGATFSCTTQGSGPAGLVWATLTVGEERRVCYQELDTNRTDPAPTSFVTCQLFARGIGCTEIIERYHVPHDNGW